MSKYVYFYGNKLYLNITNKCTNSCTFCVRTQKDGYYSEETLWLEREPTVDEVMNKISESKPEAYEEIVFCGYGEPTCRLYDMLEIAKRLKEKYNVKIRLNTNGHANLICGKDVTPLFAGLFDTVSVSLNAANACDYQKICCSRFTAEEAFGGMLEFASSVKKYVPHTVFSVVRGSIPDKEIDDCVKIARERGIEIRIRDMIG